MRLWYATDEPSAARPTDIFSISCAGDLGRGEGGWGGLGGLSGVGGLGTIQTAPVVVSHGQHAAWQSHADCIGREVMMGDGVREVRSA